MVVVVVLEGKNERGAIAARDCRKDLQINLRTVFETLSIFREFLLKIPFNYCFGKPDYVIIFCLFRRQAERCAAICDVTAVSHDHDRAADHQRRRAEQKLTEEKLTQIKPEIIPAITKHCTRQKDGIRIWRI